MFKKITSFLVTALVRSCVIFTVMSIFLYAGASIFIENTNVLPPSYVVFSLIFSLIAGLMTAFLTTNVMNVAVRAVLHYVVTLAAFIIIFSFVLRNGPSTNPVKMGAFYTLFWIIPFVIWLLIRAKNAKKKNAEKEYKPAFGKKK